MWLEILVFLILQLWEKTTEQTVTVTEISSFQLETMETFHPSVSAILNITPDHLDRHHTMEAYIRAKESITKCQTKEDTCVLNYEDEILRKFAETLKVNVLFSAVKTIGRGNLSAGQYDLDRWKRNRTAAPD